MQITTTNRADSAFGFFSGTDFSSGSGFMDAMQDAMSAVSDGDNVSVSSALAEEKQQLVESPYSMQSTDGVTYTLEEVTFTKNELQELRKQLIKEGAPEETLRQFDILADQPDGATLAQVIASLMGKKGSFSEEDAHSITALLGQIDPSGDLAGDALGLMRQGNGAAALGLIQTALDKLPLDESLDVDPDSMAALCRGLGLNSGTIQTITGLMRGRSMSLNGAQFATLMQPAEHQFTIDAANAQKLDAALEKTIKPIISKARNRMEKEKEATSRESRRVQQSKILIDRTVQQNSRDTIDATATGQESAKQARSGQTGEIRTEKLQKGAADDVLQKGEHVNNSAFVNNSKAALNAQPVQEAAQAQMENNAGEGNKGKKDGWQDLLDKIDIKPSANAQPVNAGSVVYSMLQGNLDEQLGQMSGKLEQLLANQELGRHISQQVESGVLTAMRNGAKLELQLHPAELGNLAITLIARNGEVTAHIRSEKTETMELLQRQMDTIRVNLEEQGIKVDKIDVQLESSQDQQHFMDDLAEHNTRQEEETRRQELNRLKNLAALRNEDNSDMAQQLHNIGQQARYGGNALHVVA